MIVISILYLLYLIIVYYTDYFSQITLRSLCLIISINGFSPRKQCRCSCYALSAADNI